jgi:hypothetical protein
MSYFKNLYLKEIYIGSILAKGEALSLRNFKVLYLKEIYIGSILAKGEALVRGIFKVLCSLKRRY